MRRDGAWSRHGFVLKPCMLRAFDLEILELVWQAARALGLGGRDGGAAVEGGLRGTARTWGGSQHCDRTTSQRP